MSELTQRTPGLIAAEINKIKEDTRKVVIYNSIEIGRRLTEAKELVEYGAWGNWLETEVNYSKSTANNLMKIFVEYGADQITLLGDNLKSQAFGNLNYSQAILLFGVDAEDREKFVEENNVEDMSTRELKKAIEKLKKVEKDRDSIKEKLEEAERTNEELESVFNIGAEERRQLEEEKEKLISDIKRKEEEILNLRTQPVTIEVDVTEVEMKYQEELEAARVEKEELEEKLKAIESNNSAGTEIFKVHFDNLVGNFNKLLQELANIKSNNEVQYTKLSSATKKFLITLEDRLD